MPYRIETDETLRRALGTDGAEWAEAYINQQEHACGDRRHQELTVWFDAALNAGQAAERTTIAAGLNRIRDEWPMRASDIGAFLNADRFADFIAIWTEGAPSLPDDDWKTAPACGLEAAIAEFKRTLPGWWFRVAECQVSADASCGPTDQSEHLALIPRDKRFDEGFHIDLPQPASMAAALHSVMNEALEAIAGART